MSREQGATNRASSCRLKPEMARAYRTAGPEKFVPNVIYTSAEPAVHLSNLLNPQPMTVEGIGLGDLGMGEDELAPETKAEVARVKQGAQGAILECADDRCGNLKGMLEHIHQRVITSAEHLADTSKRQRGGAGQAVTTRDGAGSRDAPL